jgi:hypothetical protein
MEVGSGKWVDCLEYSHRFMIVEIFKLHPFENFFRLKMVLIAQCIVEQNSTQFLTGSDGILGQLNVDFTLVFEQDLLWVELNTNDRVSTVLDG